MGFPVSTGRPNYSGNFITIKTYVKGQTLSVENPDKPKLQLVIDKGEYFACVEDDVDKVQSDINLMDTWSKDASERMKIKIDQRVLTDILPDISADNKGATAGRISNNIDLGTTGCRLGMIDRFTVYMSHNLSVSSGKFSIIAGHKMGFTFASQMTNMETIRSESTFGNIIRGLQVYGYKVVKPEALSQGIITL